MDKFIIEDGVDLPARKHGVAGVREGLTSALRQMQPGQRMLVPMADGELPKRAQGAVVTLVAQARGKIAHHYTTRVIGGKVWVYCIAKGSSNGHPLTAVLS